MTALDIEKTIARLKLGHLEAVLKKGGNVHLQAGHVNTLTRATLTASPGNALVVWDFSQVEARALAWAAQDHDALARFAVYDSGDHDNGDPYAAMAAQIFGGKPKDYVKGTAGEYPGRHIGKQAELGCFAADTRVLTDSGFKAILTVTTDDLLWDGFQWVTHHGVIDQGERETIDLAGVRVTPDHEVWTGRRWATAQSLARSGATLCLALENASAGFPWWVTRRGREAGLARSSWRAIVGRHITEYSPTTCAPGALPVAQSAHASAPGTGLSVIGSTPASCPTMRTALGYSTGSLQLCSGATTLSLAASLTTAGAGSRSTGHGARIARRFLSTLDACRGGISRLWSWIAKTMIGGTSQATCALLPSQSTTQTDAPPALCSKRSQNSRRVYDIAGAGPRHRFTIMTERGPLIVHNCGYGMGEKKFHQKVIDDGGSWADIIAAAGADFTPEEMASAVVAAWRTLHHPIVCYWRELQQAAVAVTQGEPAAEAGPFTWRNVDGLILCELPSGRALVYRGMRIDPDEYDRPSLSYTGRKGRERTYGGKLTENVIQAMCRDLMAEALVRAEAEGLCPVHTIHDEILCDVPADQAEDAHALMGEIMTLCPAWARGMPLAAEGPPISFRYGK